MLHAQSSLLAIRYLQFFHPETSIFYAAKFRFCDNTFHLPLKIDAPFQLCGKHGQALNQSLAHRPDISL
jgi:hypothetical protein